MIIWQYDIILLWHDAMIVWKQDDMAMTIWWYGNARMRSYDSMALQEHGILIMWQYAKMVTW